MDLKNRIGIFIFTLGVFMLLVRPLLIYQASKNKTNPAQVSNLLQRQIKKKDDSHSQVADASVIRMFTEKIAARSISCVLSDITQILVRDYTSWLQLVSHHCFQPGAP